MTKVKSTVNIGLCNPKSPTNVGAVMRAVSCFQANDVFYTGERYDRAARFYTDTQDTALKTYLEEVTCLLETVTEEIRVVCVELVEGAISLQEFEHPQHALYIFGPEDGSISQDLIDRADDVVYIPTVGCLNLAATVNVVLYDRSLKSVDEGAGNSLIRKSRNKHNRLTIK